MTKIGTWAVEGPLQKQTFRAAFAISFLAVAMSGCGDSEGWSGGNVVQSTTTPTNSAPTISGSPSAAVNTGDLYSFVPNASDSDGDQITFSILNQPSWANFDTTTGELSGQPGLADVGVYEDIHISVSDGVATATLPSFPISVNQVGVLSTTLSWTAPIENEDGTPLTDLAGFKIYWGTTPGSYPNSVTIDNPTVSTYVIENLAPGNYEFVATAFNEAGAESAYSNIATRSLR
jgi:hypothetical protein